MHTRDPDNARTQGANVMFDRATEPEIGNRDGMTVGLESRGDVFHAEGLDAKERAKTESFVARHRTQQQNLHCRIRRLA
jgi:hypothetical protein